MEQKTPEGRKARVVKVDGEEVYTISAVWEQHMHIGRRVDAVHSLAKFAIAISSVGTIAALGIAGYCIMQALMH